MIQNDIGDVRSIDLARVTRAHRLGPALAGLRKETARTAGRLAYYVAGNGPPLLLIHSINAAASAYEVRPIYDGMQATHRVYALDLPGFGHSDRSDRDYAVPLYVAAIRDMLGIIASETGVMVIDALALSLSSEFLARAALQAPSRFRTLTFVSPTGFVHDASDVDAPADATREVPGLRKLLQFALWSQALFNLLVSRAGIRYFMMRLWGSRDIDEGLFKYSYRTAHQPGAKRAPLAFVSGRLTSKDILHVYAAIATPVWAPHGTRGELGDFRGARPIATQSNWRFQSFATGARPHFERPAEFCADLLRFLRSVSP
jgi:pimeloyl-ACP methyl ester carboxylesterase